MQQGLTFDYELNKVRYYNKGSNMRKQKGHYSLTLRSIEVHFTPNLT